MISCSDSEIDELLRHGLNAMGQLSEKRRISLHANHNGGIDLYMRMKSALMLALDEATTPQINDEKPGARQ